MFALIGGAFGGLQTPTYRAQLISRGDVHTEGSPFDQGFGFRLYALTQTVEVRYVQRIFINLRLPHAKKDIEITGSRANFRFYYYEIASNLTEGQNRPCWFARAALT